MNFGMLLPTIGPLAAGPGRAGSAGNDCPEGGSLRIRFDMGTRPCSVPHNPLIPAIRTTRAAKPWFRQTFPFWNR